MTAHISFAVILFFAALCLMLIPGNTTFFIIVVFFFSATTLYLLYKVINHPEHTRFSSALALSILLGYVTGTSITIAFAVFSGENFERSGFVQIGRFYAQEDLSVALALALLSSAVLFCASYFEKPVFTTQYVNLLGNAREARILWMVAALIGVSFLTGDLGYTGTSALNEGGVSKLGTLAFLMAPPSVAFGILVLKRQKSGWRKIYLAVFIAFLMIVLLPFGRRIVIYAAVIGLMALSLEDRSSRNPFSKRRIFGLGVAIFFVYVAFFFFFALRVAIRRLGPSRDLVDYIFAALASLNNTRQAQLLSEGLLENVIQRPFILSYLAEIVRAMDRHAPLYGEVLLYSITMAVPSIIFPSKITSLPTSLEAVVHPAIGLPVFDGPNTIVTAGFVDWGFAGVILYPLALVLVLKVFYFIVRGLVTVSAVNVFVLFTLLYAVFNIEQALTGLFVTMRNMIIIIVIMVVVYKLPTVSKAPRDRRMWHG